MATGSKSSQVRGKAQGPWVGLFSVLRPCLAQWPALPLGFQSPTPVTKPRMPCWGVGEAAADSHLSMAFPLSSCLRGIGQLLGCRTPCLENGSQLVLQPSAPSIPRSWENPQSDHSTGQRTSQPWFCSQICSCPAVAPQASPSL